MDSGEEPLDRLEDEAFTDIANEVLEKCNLPGRVSRIEECRDNFFIGVYKGLLGDDLPGITDNPITVDQRIKNCQTLIDIVAAEVLSVDLSHISGKSVVEGDRISIRNLLEIFAGLLEFFMECVDDQADHDSKDSDDEDDSNLLTSEHDVISGVLREELGPSYNDINVPRFRPSGISEPSQEGERASKQPINQQHLLLMATQDSVENKQTRKPNTESMTWNGSLTGFDADTSKMSDSRADVVSDSTAELIRLGETSSDRSSRTSVRKETRHSAFRPDSQSYASTSLGPSISEQYDSFSVGVVSGSLNGSRSKDVSGRGVSRVGDTVRTNRVMVREPDSSQASHSVGRRRDCPSAEVDLTQYSLTSTELREVSERQGGKEPGKPSSSFLSASSVSASWPDQISPLEPTKSSASGGSGGFEALGVRPREQRAAAEGTDTGSGGSSGRSTPVYHHYHHHFHHTQPQPGGPGFQSVAGVSATTAVDAPDPRSSLSQHGPPAAAPAGTDRPLGVRTGPTSGDRLLQTAPGALTQPPTAPGSATGYPPPATGVRTASTLTDSVFLPASGSTGPPLVRTATSGVRSDGVSGTSSLRERLARPLTTTAASAADSSLPMSKTVPSTSFRGQETLGSSLHDRTPRTVQADRWIDRLDTLPREQPLASTFPGRPLVGEVPRTRPTDIHPPSVRRTKAAELLAKYTRPEAGESEESESEREEEDEDLAQNSDSAVDYGRSETVATASRMKSVSFPKHRTAKDSKSPRPRRAYRAESIEDDSSPDPRPRRGVTFRDTVETFPVTERMDRLRRLLYEEATEQRKHHTQATRKGYRDQLKEIQQDKEKEKRRQPKRKMPLSPNLPKKKPKKKSTMKQGGKLEKVYCSQDRRSRPTKKTAATTTTTTTTKGRKRSASASPVLSRRREGHPDALLPTMLEEFPFLHVSPQTAHSMWRKQAHHLSSVLKSGTEAKKTKTQRMIEEAERRQETLVGILKKDLDHNLRMREKQDRQQQQLTVKAKLRDKRQISARARRYYDDYELRMRARMLKRRTREEQIFKRLFQDGLELQKQRIRELRDYAKEKREAQAQRQQNEIESLENFYRDQFAMLGEGIARERYEMEVREKAQDKVVRQMRRELRQKLEHDVQVFQGNLQRDEDSAYFRQLEADRLRREFQLATRSAFY